MYPRHLSVRLRLADRRELGQHIPLPILLVVDALSKPFAITFQPQARGSSTSSSSIGPGDVIA